MNKKRRTARLKGPSHGEVRRVCTSCQNDNCVGCESENCACDCRKAAGSDVVDQHLHLKKHVPVNVPSEQVQPPSEKPEPVLGYKPGKKMARNHHWFRKMNPENRTQ